MDTENKQDITFRSQKTPTQSVDPEESKIYSPSVSELQLLSQESNFSIEQWLNRPFLLDAFDWTTSSTNGTILKRYALPYAFLNQNFPLAEIFRRFTFVRYRVELNIKIAPVQFYSGQLIVSYFPGLFPYARDGSGFLINSDWVDQFFATGLRHVTLQAADNSSAKLESVWLGYNSHTNSQILHGTVMVPSSFNPELSAEVGQGVFFIHALNQLRTGDTAATSIRVNVWASLVELDVASPVARMDDVTFVLAESQGKGGGSPINIVLGGSTSSPSAQQQQAPQQQQKKSGGIQNIVSTGMDLFKKGASLFSGDGGSSIGDIASVGMDLIGDILPFALDRPRVIDSENAGHCSLISIPAHVKGPMNAHRLGVTPAGTHAPHASLTGMRASEHDLWKIAQRPMLFRQTAWTGTQTPNTVLFSTGINPLLCATYAMSPGVDVLCPTFLCDVARSFQYWTGSIELIFEIVATNYHNGILGMIFQPGWLPGNAASADVTTLTTEKAYTPHYETLDLGELSERKFVFKIPYQCNQPYLKVHGPQTSLTAPHLGALVDDGNVNHHAYPWTLGQFTLFIVQPLVHASTVSDTVTINMYVKGGEDFHCAIPHVVDYRPPIYETNDHPFDFSRLTLTSSTRVLAQAQSDVPEQAGDQDSHPSEIPVESVPVESYTPSFEKGNFFGDIVSDIRDLIKRGTRVANQKVPITSGIPPDLLVFPHYPGDSNPRFSPEAIPGHGTGGYKTALEKWSRMFVMWHGSIRYDFVTSASKNYSMMNRVHHNTVLAPEDIAPLPFRPSWNTAYSASPLGSEGVSGMSLDIFNIATQPAMTHEVPFYSMKLRNFTQRARPDRKGFMCNNGIVVYEMNNSDPSLTELNLDLYVRAGDDFVFSHLVPPPRIPWPCAASQVNDFGDGRL